ncbi:hypothetical protein LUZ60_008275 [Juncus effusus]|nr:hypothetical protein LUZ60_008275 [Juncus effusus]
MEDDAKEDLEPLFDYTRVQPADFFSFDDSDIDKSEIFSHCRKKIKSTDVEKENKKGKDGDDDVAVEMKGNNKNKTNNDKMEEDDWLLPPPPKTLTESKQKEDNTLQELRLKKQELASLAQSAQDVLKNLVENVKMEVKSAKKPLEEVILDEPIQERQKIVISIQDKDGQKQYCIYKDDKFEKLFKIYAKKVNLKAEDLVFSFDGDKVARNQTPISLDLEDNDMLEVHVKSK